MYDKNLEKLRSALLEASPLVNNTEDHQLKKAFYETAVRLVDLLNNNMKAKNA